MLFARPSLDVLVLKLQTVTTTVGQQKKIEKEHARHVPTISKIMSPKRCTTNNNITSSRVKTIWFNATQN